MNTGYAIVAVVGMLALGAASSLLAVDCHYQQLAAGEGQAFLLEISAD